MFHLNLFVFSLFILFSLESLASESANPPIPSTEFKSSTLVTESPSAQPAKPQHAIETVESNGFNHSPKFTEFKSPVEMMDAQYIQGEVKFLNVSGERLDKIENSVGGFFLSEDVWKRLAELEDLKELQDLMKFRKVMIKDLPLVILQEKMEKSEAFSHIRMMAKNEQKDPSEYYRQTARRELDYAIHEKRPSSSFINLVEQLNYSQAEKLNLFIHILHQKGSDSLETHRILELFSKWNLDKNMEMFVFDYTHYLHLEFDDDSLLSLVKDKSITTIWHELFRSERHDVFLAIINRYPDIDINMQDMLGRSILHLISVDNLAENKKFFHTLVEKTNISFHLSDMFSDTPLITAIKHNSVLFEEFMKLPSDKIGLEIKDGYGRTPVFLALEWEVYDKAKALYDKGAVSQSGVMSQQNVLIGQDRVFYVSHPVIFEFESLLPFINAGGYVYAIDEAKDISVPIYGSVFDVLKDILKFEEEIRDNLLKGLLSGYKLPKFEQETTLAGKLLKAVRLGNVHFLKTFFSYKDNRKYLHHHFFKKSFNGRVSFSEHMEQVEAGLEHESQRLDSFLPSHLLQNKKTVEDGVVLSKTLDKARGLTLLSEAVRFNQDEVVEFLMDQGAMIASGNRFISYILQNELVIGVLNGQFVYNSPYRFRVYQNIIRRLVQDPQVTKAFLEKPTFFGLSLTDLATVRGNLFALKLFYEKGARVSRNLGIWGSPQFTLSEVAAGLEHYKTAIFIEQENLKTNPNNKKSKELIEGCQIAFQ